MGESKTKDEELGRLDGVLCRRGVEERQEGDMLESRFEGLKETYSGLGERSIARPRRQRQRKVRVQMRGGVVCRCRTPGRGRRVCEGERDESETRGDGAPSREAGTRRRGREEGGTARTSRKGVLAGRGRVRTQSQHCHVIALINIHAPPQSGYLLPLQALIPRRYRSLCDQCL